MIRKAHLAPQTSNRRAARLLNFVRSTLVMLFPSLLLILVFSYYPALRALYLSLFSWDGFNPPTFVGLTNFQSYIASPNFSIEVRNIAILACGSLLIAVTAPLLGAELVYNLKSKKMAEVYKPLLVIPMVIPFVVNVEIWSYIFFPQAGMLDTLLRDLHLDSWQSSWLGDPNIAIYCILGVGFPWVSGLSFLIYLAGLQTIPHEIMDVFRIEGRNFPQRLRYIDLPLLAGQLRLVVVLTLITALQNFVLVLLLTNGGPGVATMVPGLDMYLSAFSYDEWGLGMAIGTLIFLAILALTLVLMRSSNRASDAAR